VLNCQVLLGERHVGSLGRFTDELVRGKPPFALLAAPGLNGSNPKIAPVLGVYWNVDPRERSSAEQVARQFSAVGGQIIPGAHAKEVRIFIDGLPVDKDTSAVDLLIAYQQERAEKEQLKCELMAGEAEITRLGTETRKNPGQQLSPNSNVAGVRVVAFRR
jgi:hypothetical protein